MSSTSTNSYAATTVKAIKSGRLASAAALYDTGIGRTDLPRGLVSCETEAELDRNALAAYRSYRRKAFPTIIPWVVAVRYIRDKWISTWNALTGKRSYAENPRNDYVSQDGDQRPVCWGLGYCRRLWLPVDELTQAVDK
jgi:hypothetical protein